MILDEEDLVFEINNLIDEKTPLGETIIENLVTIPAQALGEHLSAFLLVVNKDYSAIEAMDEFWEKE